MIALHHAAHVDPVLFGADLRLLRLRRGWSQARLAAEAGVSLWVVSEVERGRGGRIPVGRLVALVAAVGGRLSVRIQFQGEALDRLRDRRHAAIVERMVAVLQAAGWSVATEVSFNVFGERGSIDILAFHPGSGALLVIEVKSVVPDVGGMLMTLDKKVRLAPEIARTQLGWECRSTSRLLVLPEDRTARRRITQHEVTFSVAFPARNVAVRTWLVAPGPPIAGLMFLTVPQDANVRPARRRASPSPRTASRSPRAGKGRNLP